MGTLLSRGVSAFFGGSLSGTDDEGGKCSFHLSGEEKP